MGDQQPQPPHHHHNPLKEALEDLLPPHHRATRTLWQGRFDNPAAWGTFEVGWRAVIFMPAAPAAVHLIAQPEGSCQVFFEAARSGWSRRLGANTAACAALHLQDRSWSDVRRWNRERKQQGVPTEGWLLGNRDPTPADFLAAFPPEPVDFAALNNPPGRWRRPGRPRACCTCTSQAAAQHAQGMQRAPAAPCLITPQRCHARRRRRAGVLGGARDAAGAAGGGDLPHRPRVLAALQPRAGWCAEGHGAGCARREWEATVVHHQLVRSGNRLCTRP